MEGRALPLLLANRQISQEALSILYSQNFEFKYLADLISFVDKVGSENLSFVSHVLVQQHCNGFSPYATGFITNRLPSLKSFRIITTQMDDMDRLRDYLLSAGSGQLNAVENIHVWHANFNHPGPRQVLPQIFERPSRLTNLKTFSIGQLSDLPDYMYWRSHSIPLSTAEEGAKLGQHIVKYAHLWFKFWLEAGEEVGVCVDKFDIDPRPGQMIIMARQEMARLLRLGDKYDSQDESTWH